MSLFYTDFTIKQSSATNRHKKRKLNEDGP